MNKILPSEAFAYYVALGPQRNFQQVANHFDVHRRTVARTADREAWNERLEAIEKEAREAADKRMAKDIEEMHLRHRKMLTAMASRAARALQEFPLTSGMEGMKAAALVIKLERLLSGEPTERTSVDIEQLIRREHQELMVIEGGGGGEDEDVGEEGDDDLDEDES